VPSSSSLEVDGGAFGKGGGILGMLLVSDEIDDGAFGKGGGNLGMMLVSVS
jgi:hypothetical protein